MVRFTAPAVTLAQRPPSLDMTYAAKNTAPRYWHMWLLDRTRRGEGPAIVFSFKYSNTQTKLCRSLPLPCAADHSPLRPSCFSLLLREGIYCLVFRDIETSLLYLAGLLYRINRARYLTLYCRPLPLCPIPNDRSFLPSLAAPALSLQGATSEEQDCLATYRSALAKATGGAEEVVDPLRGLLHADVTIADEVWARTLKVAWATFSDRRRVDFAGWPGRCWPSPGTPRR